MFSLSFQDIKTDASKSANTKTAGLKRTASSVLTSSSSSNYGRGNLAAAKQCSVGEMIALWGWSLVE